MNPLHYLYLLLRYSWLIILILAAALGGTWVWLGKQSPVYASRGVLQVDTAEAKVVKIQEVVDTKVTGTEELNTLVQTLSSNKVMLAVARATGFSADYNARLKASGDTSTDTENAIANAVASQVKISLRKSTRLIDIVAEASNPKKAQALASEVLKQFFILQGHDQSDVSKDAYTFLKAQSEELRKKVTDSDTKLAEYRQQSKAVSLDKDQNIVSDRVKVLSSKVTSANSERASLESDLAALKNIPANDVEGMLKLRAVATLPDVEALRSAVVSKEGAFAAIKERYKWKHPKYLAAESELNEVRGKLKTAVASAGDTLRQQYRTFAETEERLGKMLKAAEEEAIAFDKIAFPYNALKREADTDREMYQSILTRLKETDITSSLTKTPYRVVEEPLINPNPVRPNRNKTLATAGFLGLFLGLGLILLFDYLDSSIRTVDEAEKILELGVLSAVPDGDASKIPKGGTVMTDDANSSQAEAYRTLRASLSLLGDESQRRVILVTSAVPAEGKTFTAANLSAAFATQGLNTLLIDADLRRPALSATMLERDVRQDEEFRGLTDVLSGLCSPEQAIRATGIQNLSLLPSGRRAPNPAELLAQGGVEKLIAQLSENYDRIIFDSAPVNAVSDTLSIAPLAHAVCLVLRFGKTPRRAILRALGLLRKSNARMAGVVMNRMPGKRGAAYYYYYYGDPYVQNSVYGGDGGKKKKRPNGLDDDAPWPESAAAIPTSRLPQAKK